MHACIIFLMPKLRHVIYLTLIYDTKHANYTILFAHYNELFCFVFVFVLFLFCVYQGLEASNEAQKKNLLWRYSRACFHIVIFVYTAMMVIVGFGTIPSLYFIFPYFIGTVDFEFMLTYSQFN